MTRSGWLAPAADGRTNAPSACSPTGATATLAAGSCCVLAASHTSSPERKDQRQRRRGRPPKFDREAYRGRNVVERCVNQLKQWRGVATRYEKRAANYRATVVIAALMIWLSS